LVDSVDLGLEILHLDHKWVGNHVDFFVGDA
jgi:hypothetical protein